MTAGESDSRRLRRRDLARCERDRIAIQEAVYRRLAKPEIPRKIVGCVVSVNIPANLSGVQVWFHTLEGGNLKFTNGLAMKVQ